MFYAVWGSVHTGRALGTLGEFPSREEAQREADRFNAENGNPQSVAWVSDVPDYDPERGADL